MDSLFLTNSRPKRMVVNILCLFVILAIAFVSNNFSVQAAQRTLAGGWKGESVRNPTVIKSANGIPWRQSSSAFSTELLSPLEGWHDGSSGEVDPNACVAFGWSVDPDNRDRDVQIHVFSDGAQVAEGLAQDYGEDMNQYGICPGGTCRFTINLWDVISHDQEHQITVQAYDVESDSWWNLEGTPKALTCVTPPPHFTVFPEWEWFDGLNWPQGATVSIDVAGKPECSLEMLSPGDFFNGGFPAGCDLASGDVVTFTDGVTNRTHTVRNLAVTALDQEHDTVSGVADAGAGIYVWPHATGQQQFVVADTGGNWQADFSGIFDLAPGESGRSEIRDEAGNATAVDWAIPNPRIVASVTSNWLRFDEFAPAETLNLQIYDTQGGTLLWAMELITDNSGSIFVGEWEQPVDLVPGTYITVASASTTKELVVEALTLDVFDPAADYLAGTAPTAPEGRFVWAGTGSQTASCGMGVTSDPASGAWSADFTTKPCDVTEDMWAFAQIFDADGDVTEANPAPPAPNPHFSAFPEWESIEGWEWPQDVNVHLMIDDPATQANPDFEQDQTVVVTPWDPNTWWVNFNFGGQYDLKVGDVVTLTDGATTRTHTVRNLAITKVNPEDELIKGTADPGAEIHVWPHATGQEQLATASPKGKWNVNFSGVFDLAAGECGRSEIRDEVGNATAVDWCVPNPRIVASITEDWFYLQEFSANTTVTFTVYQAQGGKPIWKGTTTTDGSGFAWVNAEGHWNLEPGKYLVVKDRSNTKDLVIEGFTFDTFNLRNGQLAGTAPEPYGRRVWVGIGLENDGWSMDVSTDETGAWLADFGKPVPGNYQWVAAQIFDEDGDASELRPSNIINWTLVIMNQPDWVSSGITVSAGQSFTVEAFGLMNPCSDTYPNGADYCIFFTPVGGEGLVPYENEYGIFPGPGLQFMALLGRIGDGAPFYIGAGGTFTAEQSGTLWFTPNDNLRTDNQGAYSLLVSVTP